MNSGAGSSHNRFLRVQFPKGAVAHVARVNRQHSINGSKPIACNFLQAMSFFAYIVLKE